MNVQEMSLFELALEVIKVHQGEREGKSNADKYVLLDLLAKAMHREKVKPCSYRWGNTFIALSYSKQGTPSVHVYEHTTPSLMSLPGWKEYSARKGVQAAEMVEG